jgi:hypothetical protein
MDTGFELAQAGSAEVEIMFAGHSTYVITTPAGVTIATDYNGWSGRVSIPRVVTMNKAHSSHYTLVARRAHRPCAARLELRPDPGRS